jgi:hypothetical protein
MDYIYKTRYLKLKARLNEPINFWFFGDVHRDTPNCDVERWKWFLQKAKKSMDEHETYFFGMGDYHDFASTSEKKKLRNNELHDTTIDKLDRLAESDNRAFAAEISFMRGHVLGFIEGNHSWLFRNGKNSTDDLAERLGTESLGWLCHYTIAFEFEGSKSGTNQSINFVLCHGRAGGKTAGNTINQVDDLRRIFPAADVYCMAHDHERGAWPKDVLLPSIEGELKQKRQMLCRSGSYMKGYVDNEPSYVVGRLLRPSDLGSLHLQISFHRDREEKHDRVITDIMALI